jgi:DNA-binding MarR family transcriptional regulator
MSATKHFNIEKWTVFRLWRISQEVGYDLEDFYSREYGLAPIEWHSLAALASYAPLSAKKLAELLDLNQVQMTRTLTKLLKQGLVSRKTDVHDRRRVVLSLNKKGEAIYDQIAPKAQALEEKMLSVFNKTERKQFLTLLDELENKVVSR